MYDANAFAEISRSEMQRIDGGFVIAAGITLTLGAKIAIGATCAGGVIGFLWALAD